MRYFATYVLTFFFCVCSPGQQSSALIAAEEDGFQPMLNGKDLDGWVLVNTPPETWSYKDGMLVCTGKPIGEMRTSQMYQNFIMEVEWRHMIPKGNAGIFVWADDITAKGQPFHRGIEVQVLENAYGNNRSHTTHGDIFPIHGARMTPVNGHGGSRAFPTEERSKPSPEWNHYRIECNNGDISLAVNGKVVTRGKDCSPSKGYICIESEGGLVHYRNMKIKRLPDTPVAAENVAIANRDFRSLYTGLNLNGWTTISEASWRAKDWTLSYDGKATGPATVLTSTKRFSPDLAFIVDVKLRDEQSSAIIQLVDESSKVAAAVDLKQISIAASLDKTGRWNRIEATVVDGKLSLTVNGQQLSVQKNVGKLTENMAIQLAPTGPVDFANIYVKD